MMDPLIGNEAKSEETVPFLCSFKEYQIDDHDENKVCFYYLKSLEKNTMRVSKELADFAGKAWEMGRSDPRKIIFAAKMGLALSIIYLLNFWRDSYYMDQYAIWGILTVIVMFEFSVGATLIKGFNRWLGTLVAGILAYCFAQLSQMTGKWTEVVIVSSVFLVAFFASYLKLYPALKAYEYGFRVLVMTYCILMVVGHKNGGYVEAVLTRLALIALGGGVCLAVNVCIFPIWSGDDLHNLVAKNFDCVASSLEECMNGYMDCIPSERIPIKILRLVVQSTSQEETLVEFATWEPPHGRYNTYNYPWQYYLNLSSALRHCAFTVMALHGCTFSEIQGPSQRRLALRRELERVGAEGTKVLRLVGTNLRNMERLAFPAKDVLRDVNEAVNCLEKKVLMNLDGQTSIGALSLAGFSWLLIEFVARLRSVVGSFEELSEKAKFSEPSNVKRP